MAVTRTERAAIERQTLTHLMSLLDTETIAKVFTRVLEHHDPTWTTPVADIHDLIMKAGREQANAVAKDWDSAVRKVYADDLAERERESEMLHEMAEAARKMGAAK